MAVHASNLTIASVNNYSASLIAGNCSGLGNRGLLCRQYNRIALVALAEFPAAGRSFRVIVGWCSRRAKDAQETSGIKGDDVVVPVVDYQNLEQIFKPLFELAGSNYRYTSYAKLKNAKDCATKPLASCTTKHISGVIAALPRPNPYWW